MSIRRFRLHQCSLGATALLALVFFAAQANGAGASVTGTLAQLQQAGSLTAEDAAAARTNYLAARSLRKRSKGANRLPLTNQLRTIETLARKKRLSADRVRPLFSQLQVNVEWFKTRGPAAVGTRSRFGSSRIYYQYFAGWGWQFHPLANFSQLNAVWSNKSSGARSALGKFAHELIGFGVVRGGALTWEYYFPFSGSSAPYISSISQGTAIQSLARAGQALVDPTISDAAARAVRAFGVRAPTGLRIDRDGGYHYLGYSGNRKLVIFNMFAQALNGLYTYVSITNDPVGRSLLEQGLAAARVELPKSDTGAWSLYAERGSESNLNYHQVLIDFLVVLCKNSDEALFCDLRTRLASYLTAPPEITNVTVRKRGRFVLVSFKLSKISTVTVSKRGGQSRTVTVARGKRVFKLSKAGSKTVTIFARDLAGNTTSVTG